MVIKQEDVDSILGEDGVNPKKFEERLALFCSLSAFDKR
jgi:hypothetical protein